MAHKSLAMIATLLSAWLFMVSVVGADEKIVVEVNKLLQELPEEFASPVPLFPNAAPEVRYALASNLLENQKHQLSAILTMLDAVPGVTLNAHGFASYLGPRSCTQLGNALIQLLKSHSNDEMKQEGACALLNALPYVSIELEQPLLELLFERNPLVRCQACMMLGRIKTTNHRVVEKIQQLTADDSPEVRRCAIEALRELESPESLAVVRARFTDADDTVRLAAALSVHLLEPDDPQAIDSLSRLFPNVSDDAKEQIFEQVAAMGSRSALFREVWKDKIRTSREMKGLCRNLESLGPVAVEILTELLVDSESTHARWSALLLLQWTKHDTSAARPFVRKCLNQSIERLQLQALSTLAELGNVRVQDVALLVDNPAGFLREATAQALASCATVDRDAAIKALTSMLADDQPGVQMAACGSLGRLDAGERLRNDPFVKTQFSLLDDSDANVRLEACKRLVQLKLHNERVLKRLTLMLASPGTLENDIVVRVMQTLEQVGEQAEMATPLLIKALADHKLKSQISPTHPAADALVAIGTAAVPRLIRALDSNDVAVSQRSAECLRRIGDPRAAEALGESVWKEATRPHPQNANVFRVDFADYRNVLDFDTTLEQLHGDASPLPLRLANLLQYPQYSDQARMALRELGARNVEALPALIKDYERLLELPAPDAEAGEALVLHENFTRQQCFQTARCIYEIDPTQLELIHKEIERSLLYFCRSGDMSGIGAEAVKLAMETRFRSQKVVAEFQKLAESDFVAPSIRAFGYYVLANLDSENPQWRRILTSMAGQRWQSERQAAKYLKTLNQMLPAEKNEKSNKD